MKTATLTLALSLFAFLLNGQNTIYVKHDATGANDGSSWADAYTDLEAAIDEAKAGEAIWVAAGTYTPTTELDGQGDRFRAFQMNNGVAIYGGFAGTEDPDFELDDRDFDLNETILSGDLGDGVHVYHVFRHVDLGLDNTAVLDGFTISGGKANGTDDIDKRGGGMLNSGSSSANGSSPTIRNCVFKNNEATEGGAIYNSRYCSPAIVNTVFQNNTASDVGGAVFLVRNTTTFDGCTFQNNSAEATGSDKGGGAVYITTSVSTEGTTFTNCIFIGNTVNKTSSGARGGAIHALINPGFLTITGSSFQDNEAQHGGAVYHSSGSETDLNDTDVKISNSIFEQNAAEYGGAIFSDRHNTFLKSSIIRGNDATEQSGGLYARNGSSQIINSLLSGNKSGKHGGGLYFNNETPEVINTTVSGNYAGERGGGVSMIGGSTVEIKNTIVWGNVSPEGNELWVCDGCTANIDHSLYGNANGDVHTANGGAVNATNSLHSDPKFFNPVAATESDTPNTSGIYMIKSTSPAVDAGNNAHLDGLDVTKDLRGGPRIVAGNGDATIDIGAYEYNPTCSSNPPISGTGTDTDPYIIAEPGNFCWMAQNPSDWNKHYKQITDIDLTGSEHLDGGKGLRPIGNITTKFTGSFNGQGYSISNLVINRPVESNVGLFGIIDGQSSNHKVVLRNITLINADITGYRVVGALVGLADQWSDITNCHVSGTVKGNRNTGGLVGWGRRTDFLRCSSSATVSSIESHALYHGGLIGHINSTSTVKESFATGNVAGRGRVGGLIGAIGWSSEVENSYARGSVTTDITNPMMGGLIGEVWNASVKNSYSTGAVNADNVATSEFGGLVGNITTDNNFSDENNFWDTETSEISDSEMGIGKNTSEMKDENTFTDWDFDGTWSIDPAIKDGYPYLKSSLIIWTGENDTDWNNVSNWDPTIVPSTGANILIPGALIHYPVLDGDRSVGNLSIANNAMLTITPGTDLTVNGELINSAGPSGLLIQSSDTGTGSLIHNSEGVEATVERYIVSAPNWPGSDKDDGTRGWHFLSSPVANQSISGDWTPDGEDNDYDFYAWDEGGTWLNQKADPVSAPFITFLPGKGYLVAYQQTDIRTFIGELNNDDVTVTLVHSGAKENGWVYESGWNLLGNPYPSAIDWTKADHSSFENVFAYIYDRNAGNGGDYVQIGEGSQDGEIIPAHQGFFVLADADPGEFTFTNDMRVHGDNFMKDQPVGENVRLRITKADFYSDTRIRILEEAEYGTDRYDAHKLFSMNPNMPQVYSYTEDNTRVAINSIPTVNEEVEIALGMRLPADGEYSLSLQEFGGTFEDVPVLLKDKKEGLVHDLKASPTYIFMDDGGDLTDRFALLFHRYVTSVDDPLGGLDDLTRIYVYGQTLYLEFAYGDADRLLEVFDTSGRLLMRENLGYGARFSRLLNLHPGVYVVRVSGTHSSEAMKLIIQP